MFSIAGVLEGFYGTPWTWEQRRSVMERCIPAGLPWYAWAPKSDPLHREQWRKPFSTEYLSGFADLLTLDGLKLCISMAPGLDAADFGINFADDLAALVAKLEPVVALVESNGSHIPLVMIALDDLGPEVTDPARHARVVSALSEWFGDRIQLCVCPVHYAGTNSTEYLSILSNQIPAHVLMAWTGACIVNEAIHAYDAQAFSRAVNGRPLLLWDNYPVNDAFMRDQIFLHPMRGRDPQLSEFCTAYLANAGVQPMLSIPPLLSAGAWCEGGVATECWDQFEDPENLDLFAQACEGSEFYQLGNAAITDVNSPDFRELTERLHLLAGLELKGEMGNEAAPWLKQTKVEAALSLVALDLLKLDQASTKAPDLLLRLLLKWPNVRRSNVSAFGPRLGVRPALGMSAEGVWTATAPLIIEDRNTTDLLCRAALERHTQTTVATT
jgi:hypothetical protein